MLNEYVKDALRTESTLHEDRILHAVLGMVTESAELLHGVIIDDAVNIKEELGDILWYAAIVIDEMKIDTEPLLSMPPLENPEGASLIAPASHMCVAAGILADHAKRCLFYGQAIPEEDFVLDVVSLLFDVQAIAQHQGFTLQEICDTNIAKLKVRYPDKFTVETAIERDLARERKILEN